MSTPNTSGLFSPTPLWLGVGCCLLALTGCGRDRPDFQRLQGSWEATKVVIDGHRVTERLESEDAGAMRNMRLTFAGSKVTFQLQDTEHTGYWRVDAQKKPRRLRIVPPAGNNEHQPLYAIYEFDDHDRRLKVCFSQLEYPDEFDADRGDGCILVSFERQR